MKPRSKTKETKFNSEYYFMPVSKLEEVIETMESDKYRFQWPDSKTGCKFHLHLLQDQKLLPQSNRPHVRSVLFRYQRAIMNAIINHDWDKLLLLLKKWDDVPKNYTTTMGYIGDTYFRALIMLLLYHPTAKSQSLLMEYFHMVLGLRHDEDKMAMMKLLVTIPDSYKERHGTNTNVGRREEDSVLEYNRTVKKTTNVTKEIEKQPLESDKRNDADTGKSNSVFNDDVDHHTSISNDLLNGDQGKITKSFVDTEEHLENLNGTKCSEILKESVDPTQNTSKTDSDSSIQLDDKENTISDISSISLPDSSISSSKRKIVESFTFEDTNSMCEIPKKRTRKLSTYSTSSERSTRSKTADNSKCEANNLNTSTSSIITRSRRSLSRLP